MTSDASSAGQADPSSASYGGYPTYTPPVSRFGIPKAYRHFTADEQQAFDAELARLRSIGQDAATLEYVQRHALEVACDTELADLRAVLEPQKKRAHEVLSDYSNTVCDGHPPFIPATTTTLFRIRQAYGPRRPGNQTDGPFAYQPLSEHPILLTYNPDNPYSDKQEHWKLIERPRFVRVLAPVISVRGIERLRILPHREDTREVKHQLELLATAFRSYVGVPTEIARTPYPETADLPDMV